MQVNLRKANAIQAEIRKAISAVKVETTVSVTEYTADVDAALAEAKAKLFDAIKRKEQLNKALFDIRAAVGRANAQAISDVLTQVQEIDGKMAIVGVGVSATEAKPLAEIQSRIEKMKATPAEAGRMSLYGDRYNVVETGLVSREVIDTFKAELKDLKRKKQVLQDELLTLNVSTNITLSPETVDVLKDEGIL